MGSKRSSLAPFGIGNDLKRLLITLFFILVNYSFANAITTSGYNTLQESTSLVLSLASLVLAIMIFQSLRGGALGQPWILIAAAFALAGAASAIRLFDLHPILFTEYDFRAAILVARLGAMLLMLAGLIFYKKGL